MATLDEAQARRIAISAEALYLCNLLLMPLLAFLLLLVLHHRHRRSGNALAANHLRQTVKASLWAALLLLPLPLLVILSSGLDSPGGWTAAILYVVVCHTTLVLGGVIGLARAMAGRPWRFPLIGGRER